MKASGVEGKLAILQKHRAQRDFLSLTFFLAVRTLKWMGGPKLKRLIVGLPSTLDFEVGRAGSPDPLTAKQ
jgi:hypothetical protein